MALSDTLRTMLTGKAVAVAATLTIVSGTTAGATGALPHSLQASFDDMAGGTQEATDPSDGGEALDPEPGVDDTTEVDPVEDTDETVDDPSGPDVDETEDPTGDTDEPEDTEEAEETDDTAATDRRSARATQVLGDLGGGCMPQDDDCHFGHAVSERAREKEAERSSPGKHEAATHAARHGQPTDPGTPDETDTTDEAEGTDGTDTPDGTDGPDQTDTTDGTGGTGGTGDGDLVVSSTSDTADQGGPATSKGPKRKGR